MLTQRLRLTPTTPTGLLSAESALRMLQMQASSALTVLYSSMLKKFGTQIIRARRTDFSHRPQGVLCLVNLIWEYYFLLSLCGFFPSDVFPLASRPTKLSLVKGAVSEADWGIGSFYQNTTPHMSGVFSITWCMGHFILALFRFIIW